MCHVARKPTGKEKARSRVVFLWRAVLIGAALLAFWIVYVLATHNFHVVTEGQAYRAGQMSSNELVRCIRRHQIRSIVNLRGEHADRQWYQNEVLAAVSQDVVHRSIALSSGKWVSVEELRELITIFKEVPKPVLIHCDGGADRTSFAAAVYATEFANTSPGKAEKEFSIWYGYLPFIWKKKAQLRESFRAYVRNRDIAARRRELGR